MKSPVFRVYVFTLVYLIVTGCASKIQVGKFDKTAQPSTPEQEILIEEGIKAHDLGDYDSAIQKYQEVLAISPDNVLALYELSFTYFVKQEWQQSLDVSIIGTNYDSPYRSAFYSVIGSCLSNMQRSKEAIIVFKDALARFPDDHMLQYNLGITYYQIGQFTHGKEYFKKALSINPQHASSHLALANSFYKENNEIPALMAYCRFLILEPNSDRSLEAQEKVLMIIGGGVQEDSLSPNQINISLNPDLPTSEGDFGEISLALGLITATAISDTSGQGDNVQSVVYLFDSLFKIMSEVAQNDEKTGFGWEFYVPFFTDLQSQGFAEVFVQRIFQLEASDEAQMAQFLEWAENY